MTLTKSWSSNVTKSIYIAGPMSGIPEFNFPAFYEAERLFSEQGWTVYNPANKEDEKALDPVAFETGDNVLVIEKGFDFAKCYLWDVEHVIKADAIYMLKGWERSPGAIGEHAVAVAMQKHYPHREIYYE